MSILHVVSVPIGHPGDITVRAVKTLQRADFVVCEEEKVGRRLLRSLKIDRDLTTLNEHNELEATETIIGWLLEGRCGALFSDAGTPLLADPGTYLVRRCHESGIRVVPVPGASSLMAALAIAGLDIRQFFFAGFLARQSVERRRQLQRYLSMSCPIVLLDTPYRLKALLADLQSESTPDRRAVLMLSLTQPAEAVVRGTITEILMAVKRDTQKREFVLIVEPRAIGAEPVSSRSRRKKR
jgi:16S rRNA (cytidine1402-2'-O)-methyltransferase